MYHAVKYNVFSVVFFSAQYIHKARVYKKKNIFSATLPLHIFGVQRAINELNTVLEMGDSPLLENVRFFLKFLFWLTNFCLTK